MLLFSDRRHTGQGASWSLVHGPLPALLVALAAVAYHATYFMAGYNVADDGHYAQVAYEFWLGANPHDIRFGYGLLWHHLGAWLFALTGPDFAVVQGIFFAAIVAATVLAFLSVREAAGNPVLAALAAAAAGAAPAFPPTAFYAFCALINVWTQLRMARRVRDLRPIDMVVPAAALAVTFQIRADFGYVFSVPFVGLLLYACLYAAPRNPGRRLRRCAALALAAFGAFAAAHVPLLAAALAGGWADLVFAEYLRYPKAVLHVLELAFAAPGAAVDAPAGAGTLLARTPLSALWTAPRETAVLALLTYGPLVVVPAFVAVEALTARVRSRGRAADVRLAQSAVVTVGALSSFPHYFLFRPDVAHIANFMPGFLVLLAVFAGRLVGGAGGRPIAWLAAGPAVAGIALYACSYVWIGLTQPGTGSIALTHLHDRPFTAQNGVDVRVTAHNLAVLEPLRDLIAAHAGPDDPIVCVPFCPGVAFMSARRMLFREHYVDDSFLISDPGWIDRAIRATVDQRPPVVVVYEWAVNGTDISRFDVWARRYVDAVAALAVRTVVLPGVRAYVLRPPRDPEARTEEAR